MATTDYVFTPPGPGRWSLDRSHYVGGISPILEEFLTSAPEAAYAPLFERLGVPATAVAFRFVHGFTYTRLIPLVGADSSPSRPPPTFAVWAMSRIHPEFRRRSKRAEQTLANPPWPAELARWHNETKPRLVAEGDAFQKLDPESMTDEQLASHLSELVGWTRDLYEEHFRLHIWDMAPIGLLLLHAERWGIDAAEVLSCLQGASPSTQAPRQALFEIREEIDAAQVEPNTLDDVRNASPRAAALLATYLQQRGDILYDSYDVTGRRLVEAPEVIVNAIREASPPSTHPGGVTAAVRSSVPSEHAERFDQLLADAREAMDLRDDNGPITVQRPLGLLRRAMLELGWRLAGSGRIDDPDHIFDAGHRELIAIARGASDPTGHELRRRAQVRHATAKLDPPATLGPAPANPDPAALPHAMGELVMAIAALMRYLAMDDEGAAALAESAKRTDWPRRGVGIGATSYTGSARVVTMADEAMASLIPGEVLVVPTTSPAFNLALTNVGALVTATGGPLSHAAVLARELDFPAVVGVGSFEDIATGDQITVDAAAGEVSRA